jgi:hypothetical protein
MTNYLTVKHIAGQPNAAAKAALKRNGHKKLNFKDETQRIVIQCDMMGWGALYDCKKRTYLRQKTI